MDDLCFATARSLVEALREGSVSAREVLVAHLTQIERANQQINAIVTLVEERAFATAARLDERQARGEPLGPLHGLPIAHKDTLRTAGIRTTFGSPVFADFVPHENDLLIERLQAAGVVTMGKANTPEFAAGSHTFNPVFGATRNPWDLARSAGGSSGGGAAALAAGMQPIADGSDMGGSLRNPASFCNVVGLRPTPGVVPVAPALDLFATLSVEGAMARTADDVALVLSAVGGDSIRSPLRAPRGADFGAPIERDLTGLRVAVSCDLGGLFPLDAPVRAAVTGTAAHLEALGCDVGDGYPRLDGAEDVFRVLRAHAFELSYGALAEDHPGRLKPSLAANIELGARLTGPEVGAASRERSRLYAEAAQFFSSYDVLVLATSQVLPFDVDLEYPAAVDGLACPDYLGWMASCFVISILGMPACSVPVALSAEGLPIGAQLVGPPGADMLLLQVAHALAQQAGVCGLRPPTS